MQIFPDGLLDYWLSVYRNGITASMVDCMHENRFGCNGLGHTDANSAELGNNTDSTSSRVGEMGLVEQAMIGLAWTAEI